MSNNDQLRKKWGVETSDSNARSEGSTSPSLANENKNVVVESKYFKVDTASPYITSLKVICRDGHTVFIPYPLQPIIEYIPKEGIYIRTIQKTVLITGRNLPLMLDHLGSQRVTWIKESASGTDSGIEEIFIQTIDIINND